MRGNTAIWQSDISHHASTRCWPCHLLYSIDICTNVLMQHKRFHPVTITVSFSRPAVAPRDPRVDTRSSGGIPPNIRTMYPRMEQDLHCYSWHLTLLKTQVNLWRSIRGQVLTSAQMTCRCQSKRLGRPAASPRKDMSSVTVCGYRYPRTGSSGKSRPRSPASRPPMYRYSISTDSAELKLTATGCAPASRLEIHLLDLSSW